MLNDEVGALGVLHIVLEVDSIEMYLCGQAVVDSCSTFQFIVTSKRVLSEHAVLNHFPLPLVA